MQMQLTGPAASNGASTTGSGGADMSHILDLPQAPDHQDLSPIDDSVDDVDKTLRKLVTTFGRYRDDDRRRYQTYLWRQFYRAYHGLPPIRPDPYRITYFIRESFRQIETLKPLVVEQFMPGEDLFKYLPEHPGEEDAKAAATRIVHKQIRSSKSGILVETEMMKWIEGAIMWGTSVLVTGWQKFRYTQRKPRLIHEDNDNMELAWDRETEEIMAGCPFAQHYNPWEYYSHPEIEDPRRSPYFFLQSTCSVSDLKTLVEEGYLDEDACKEAADQIAGGSTTLPYDQDVDFTRPDYSMMYHINDQGYDEDNPHELLTCWSSNGWEYVLLDRKHLLRAQRLRDGRMPVHCLRNYPQPNVHWGISELQVILEEQKLLNDFTSMYADSVKQCVTPRVLTKRGADTTDYNKHRVAPGAAIPCDDPNNGPKPLVMPPAPQEMLEHIGFVGQKMVMGTGVTAELAGTGSEASTATGQVHLENAANKRIQHKIRWFSPAVRQLYRDFYDLNSEYLSEQVRIRYEGEDGAFAFVEAGPEVFGDEVEVQLADQTSGANPESINSALQLLQLLNNDPLTNQLELRVNVFRAMGFKRPRLMLNNPATSPVKALSENRDWWGTGAILEPSPSDDHGIHLQIHTLILQTAMAQQSVPPSAIAAMQNHIALHQAYMQNSPPPGPPPGAPPGGNGPNQTPMGGPPPNNGPVKNEANARTEKTFSNGVTGAARQGTMPR